MLNGNLNKKSNILCFVYFILGFLSLTVLPYFFPVNYYLVSLVFLAISFIGLVMNSKFELDIVAVLLFIRAGIFIVNCLIMGINIDVIIGQERCTLASLLVYVWAKNFIGKKDNGVVGSIVCGTALITSVQIFATFIYNGGDKDFLGAAIGMSNYAATFLLFCVTYLMFTKTDVMQKIIACISVVALIVTQSFGAYIALIVIFIIFAITKFNWKSKWTYIGIVGTVLTVAILFIVSLKTGVGSSITTKVTDKITYLFQGNLEDFGSSRISLYKFSLNNIKKNWLFGAVLNVDYYLPSIYRWQYFRTHNFLLESLLLYGVVGTLINGAIIFFSFRMVGKNFWKDKEKRVYFLILLGGLIHGLIEPNLFTFNYSLYFAFALALFSRGDKKQKLFSLRKKRDKNGKTNIR